MPKERTATWTSFEIQVIEHLLRDVPRGKMGVCSTRDLLQASCRSFNEKGQHAFIKKLQDAGLVGRVETDVWRINRAALQRTLREYGTITIPAPRYKCGDYVRMKLEKADNSYFKPLAGKRLRVAKVLYRLKSPSGLWCYELRAASESDDPQLRLRNCEFWDINLEPWDEIPEGV